MSDAPKFIIWNDANRKTPWTLARAKRDAGGMLYYERVAEFEFYGRAESALKAAVIAWEQPTAPLTLADALDTVEALRERVGSTEGLISSVQSDVERMIERLSVAESLAVKLTEDVEALSVEDGDLDRINDELKELRSDLDGIDMDEAIRGLVSEDDMVNAIDEAKSDLGRADQDNFDSLEETITELRKDIGDGDERTDKRITDLEYRIERSVARISLVEASTFSACSTFAQRLRWLLTGKVA